MPVAIDPGTLADIGAGRYAHAILLMLDLPDEGPVGLWPGNGPLLVNGVTYLGAGSLLAIEQIDMGVELAASPVSASLRAQPNADVTPDVLASVDNYAYKNAAAYLTLVYIDKSTGALATAILVWQGYVDRISHDETVGGEYVLTAHLEPASLDHSRVGYRMRSDADQKLIDPDDRGFEHAATTGTEQLPYGRSANAGTPSGFTWPKSG